MKMIKIYYLSRKLKIAENIFVDEVVYVGRSKNIKSRVSKHKADKVFDSYGVFEEVETLIEAKKREDSYIRHYNPEYNRCLNKTGTYRKMQEILDENNLNNSEFGELINLLIKGKVKPIFKDNYNPHEIHKLISFVRFGG